MISRDDVKEILHILTVAYPNFNLKTQKEAEEMIEIWHMMLSEYDKKKIILAIKAYITTDNSGFAPTIGQLIDKSVKLDTFGESNEMQAWAAVKRTISNGIYGAEEEFEKLPPIIQKSVGSPSQIRSWAMDEEYNENVAASNFMRAYRMELNRQKEYKKLPGSIRGLIAETIDMLPDNEKKE